LLFPILAFFSPHTSFAFQTFIMSSEPFFPLPQYFRHSISLLQHSRPLATPRTLSPNFRFPLHLRFWHFISLPQQFHPKHTLLHFQHRSQSRPATLLLPVTLRFTFLFWTFSNFHLHVTTVQNGLRGLGHKRGVLSCTVTSPNLSPKLLEVFPVTSHTFRCFRCFLHLPTPSTASSRLPTLTYFSCTKSKFRSIVTFFFILQRGGLPDSLFRLLSRFFSRFFF